MAGPSRAQPKSCQRCQLRCPAAEQHVSGAAAAPPLRSLARMEHPTNTDPASRSPGSWNGRLAALKSRQVPDDDPRVAECLAALAFWRCKRVIDAQAPHLVPEHAGALADQLHQEAVAG